MKQFATLLFILLVMPLMVFGQANIKLASDVWPPFTNIETEQAFAYALVKEGLSRSYVTTQNHIVSFDDVIQGISDKVYDGSAALWKTSEREEYLLYSQPYLQNQLILVGRKGMDVSASTLEGLKGKTIAVVSSYAYGDVLSHIPNTEYIAGKNDQDNLQKLLKGEVDYMLVDRLLIEYLVMYQQEEVAQYLSIGSSTLLTRGLHLAIRKDVPDAQGIIQRFNESILKMVADGTYNQILQLNWIQTDVDGDGRMEYVLHGDEGGTAAPSSSYSVYFNQPGSTASPNPASRYYIQGKYYESWNQVPDKYKKPIAPASDGNFNILNFKIN